MTLYTNNTLIVYVIFYNYFGKVFFTIEPSDCKLDEK